MSLAFRSGTCLARTRHLVSASQRLPQPLFFAHANSAPSSRCLSLSSPFLRPSPGPASHAPEDHTLEEAPLAAAEPHVERQKGLVERAILSSAQPGDKLDLDKIQYPLEIYTGPVAKAFWFLKAFSLSSLATTAVLAPFIFILDAELALSGRIFLAGAALSTTTISTALISYCASPYVASISLLEPPAPGHPNPAIRLLTYSTFLQPRYTTLTTPLFLTHSSRPLSTWHLRPLPTLPTEPFPDIVAQTTDKHGKVLGEWDGEHAETGSVNRFFMVHEDVLDKLPAELGVRGWKAMDSGGDYSTKTK